MGMTPRAAEGLLLVALRRVRRERLLTALAARMAPEALLRDLKKLDG